MHGAVTEPSEYNVEFAEGNYLTGDYLTGRCPFDVPRADSVSRTSSIAMWSDDHLSTEQASSKREACTSSTPRNSDSSIERAPYAVTTYDLVDLIPIHQSTVGSNEGIQPCTHKMALDQNHIPQHVSTEEEVPMRNHTGVIDSPESHINIQGQEDECAPGENRDSNATLSRASKAFACPYFRFDSIRHIDCLSRKLNRIKDVKQHLARRHSAEPTESQHTGENIEGVSSSARDLLKVRVDRRLPPESQWHTFWDILFKRTGPVLGPYLGNPEEEIIGVALEICRKSSSEAVSSFLVKRGLSVSRIGLFQSLMGKLLESLGNCSEEQLSGSGMRESPEISLDQTLNNDLMHTKAPCDSLDSPKNAAREENQQIYIPSSQVQPPSVENDLLLHELPGLEDWGSISEEYVFTLYNESNHNETPILTHVGEPDCTFNESPNNSTEYNSSAPTAAPPEASRRSEPPSARSKRQKLEKSYIWKCHECDFQNSFTSGTVCQNYPCQHQYYPDYCVPSYLLIDD